jgi:acetyltransferase-like isoleucine patch superfamily enzyme
MSTEKMLTHDWFPQPLPANVTLGQRSWCYSSFSCLHQRSERPCAVRVGHDTGIYNGTFFDLGPQGEVQIGNYCTVVGAIISTNSRVEIRDYAFLAHEVVVADSFVAMPPGARGKEGSLYSYRGPSVITVGENAWVGARAVLLLGTQLGEGSIVGAGAVVNFAVPPFAVVAGNPAEVVGWVGQSHLRRARRQPAKLSLVEGSC